MASYIKRGDSYRIKSYTNDGKVQYYTWKPNISISKNKRKVASELQKQMVEFEKRCKNDYKACDIKFKDFVIDDWLIHYAKKRYKPSTYNKMGTIVKRVNSEIGDLRLDSITRKTLRRMLERFEDGTAKICRKPLNPKTIRNTLSMVSSVFEYAKDLELLEKNPCDNIRKPTSKVTEKEYYSVEEANLLFDLMSKKAPILYQVFYSLALYSGMRLGELCGLEWRDVNFENQTIFIKRSAYKIQNENKKSGNSADIERVVTSPKTKSSIRCIKLPQLVFDLLNELKKHYHDEEFRLGTAWSNRDEHIVFRGNFGYAISPCTLSSWLKRFCKKNNLKRISTHDFRHLNASLLIHNGCDVKTVQYNFGHAQASTTMNIYAYAFMEQQTAVSECISEKIKIQ